MIWEVPWQLEAAVMAAARQSSATRRLLRRRSRERSSIDHSGTPASAIVCRLHRITSLIWLRVQRFLPSLTL